MNPAHLGIGMTSQRTRERLVQRLREEGIQSSAVLEAIRTMPRHIFVDEALASRAYEDTALPIGYGQTISQPYVVARMSEALLAAGRLANVLEIGTGSGYQTAILATLVTRVFSVERIGALLRRARIPFAELGLRNIQLKHCDGHMGWPERAPFDGILVTAAPAELPQGLLGQLSIGGRLVLPLGDGVAQELAVITRTRLGFQKARLERVSFVPLRGGTA